MIEAEYERGTTEYEVRRYRPGDREAYLALHETVYSAKSERWFEWRYGVPYLDHVPIFVAVTDGVVAGAEAFLPFRLATDDAETLAVQPADAMVHPDHRRRGLFTRLTEAAIDYYADREPTHFFNFPTPAAKPALLQLGWREVGRIPTWYRVQNPRPVLAERVPAAALSAVSRTVKAGLDGYCRVRGRAIDPTVAESVDSFDRVPVRLLANLATRASSSSVCVRRDEAYYRWRFANPRWESVTTYVSSDDEPTAAVIAATHRTRGATVTKVLDAVTAGEANRRDELAALLEAVVDDAPKSDLFAVAESTVPADVLAGCGFVSDERPLLSSIRTPTDLVVRPVDPADGWRFGDRALSDLETWRLTFADQDTPF